MQLKLPMTIAAGTYFEQGGWEMKRGFDKLLKSLLTLFNTTPVYMYFPGVFA